MAHMLLVAASPHVLGVTLAFMCPAAVTSSRQVSLSSDD